MENLIVIASPGRVRLMQYQESGDGYLGHAHLVEAPDSIIEIYPQHRGAVVTDQSGRFGQSTTPERKAGMSYGEEHNLETELENQTLRQVAATINGLLADAGFPPWRLVFPQAQLPRLLRLLSVATRNSLMHCESGDWTKLRQAEIENRLLVGRSP
jgi:hypothetical protein